MTQTVRHSQEKRRILSQSGSGRTLVKSGQVLWCGQAMGGEEERKVGGE